MTIILEHTSNASAKLIQFWMLVHAVLRLRIPRFTYNHLAILDDDTGMVYEAIDDGVVKWTIQEHYAQKHYRNHYEVKYIDLFLSDHERENMITYLEMVRNRKYEYVNFLWHVVYTLFGYWVGSKNDNRLYCYELGTRAMNATGKYFLYPFLNPYEFERQMRGVKL